MATPKLTVAQVALLDSRMVERLSSQRLRLRRGHMTVQRREPWVVADFSNQGRGTVERSPPQTLTLNLPAGAEN